MLKKYLISSFLLVFLSNCTAQYKVVGKYESFNEVFIGTVDSNLLTGASAIKVETVPSKMKCQGSSKITYIPAISYIVPVCKGQKGIATLMCSLTGKVETEFTVTSCTSGYGTGFDKQGRMFAFTFGLKEEEAKIEIERLMSEVKNKPKLPIYEPEKVRKKKGYSTGTAFFISNDGHMITNYHVIKNSNKVTVVLEEDKEVNAKVVFKDKVNDIAIVKINNQIIEYPLPITNSNSSSVGDEVFTLGYPLVDIQGKELKATFGRINSMTGLKDDTRLMQVDVPIQPGNSGGPLINSKGEVVGIVTATLDSIVTLYKSGTLPQNVNFAMKSDYVIPAMNNISEPKKLKGNKKFSEWVKRYRNSVRMIIAR